MFRNAANKLLRSVSVTRTSASTLTIKMPKSSVNTWASLSSQFFPRGNVQPFHLRSMSTESKTEKVEKTDMEKSVTEEVAKATDEKPQATLILELKYSGKGDPVINGLERVSKPGRRIYAGYGEIPWVRSGLGINILSTPNGLMTGRKARRARVGGEILANVW